MTVTIRVKCDADGCDASFPHSPPNEAPGGDWYWPSAEGRRLVVRRGFSLPEGWRASLFGARVEVHCSVHAA